MRFLGFLTALFFAGQMILLAADGQEVRYETWELLTDISTNSVYWPSSVKGGRYVIEGVTDLLLMLPGGRVIAAAAERVQVDRSGIQVKRIEIVYVPTTKREVVAQLEYLIKQFKLIRNRIETFEAWKRKPEGDSITIRDPSGNPSLFIEVYHSKNREKPWSIRLSLDFRPLVRSATNEQASTEALLFNNEGSLGNELSSAQALSSTNRPQLRFENWDLVKDISTNAVRWPAGVKGDEYVIEGSTYLKIILPGSRVISPHAERVEVNRGGDQIKRIEVVSVWMAKREVISEVDALMQQFKIMKNGVDTFEAWKPKPDGDSISMGNPRGNPSVFIEVNHSFNREKPWYIRLSLGFDSLLGSSTNELSSTNAPPAGK